MRRIAVLVVLLLVTVAVGVTAFRWGAGDRQPPASEPASSSRNRLATPLPSETGPPGADPDPRWAGEVFARAFLDRSQRRNGRLADVCSERLAQLLARTDPAEVPSAEPVGRARMVATSDEVTTVVQRLSDGTSLAIDLVPDEIRRLGWVVTSVRPGER